jgi:hypothetical protein
VGHSLGSRHEVLLQSGEAEAPTHPRPPYSREEAILQFYSSGRKGDVGTMREVVAGAGGRAGWTVGDLLWARHGAQARTPLHFAAFDNKLHVIRLLREVAIEWGVDRAQLLALVDANGDTAAVLAEHKLNYGGDTNVLDYLQNEFAAGDHLPGPVVSPDAAATTAEADTAVTLETADLPHEQVAEGLEAPGGRLSMDADMLPECKPYELSPAD